MNITDVSAYVLSYPMERAMWDSRKVPITARNTVLVEVHTDEGLVGMGEAQLGGASPIVMVTLIERELGPLITGHDALMPERIWGLLWHRTYGHGRRGLLISAMSAIDIALWDIAGKATSKPLYKLLGGFRDIIPTYAAGGFYAEGKTIDDLVAEMVSYVDQGFKGVKMKIGGLSIREDLERVAAVRKAIGEQTLLAVDANNAFLPKEAIEMARELERYNIAWFEEPVSTEDLQGSAQVRDATCVPIAGYETESTRYGYRELIVHGAVDIVQPDVTWSGGFSECRKIAALASAWNLPCMPHTSSSAVAHVANLHFIGSISNSLFLEVDCNPNPLRESLLVEPLSIDAYGNIALPESPGLGIELNKETFKRFLVRS